MIAIPPIATERAASKPLTQWHFATRKKSVDALNAPKGKRRTSTPKIKTPKAKRSPPRRVVWLEAAPSAPRQSATIHALKPNSIHAKISRELRDREIAA